MLLLPIGDENPKSRTPYVNYALLAINVVAFLLNFPEPTQATLASYALTPSHPTPLTLITSMFLHAGFFHLLGNMVFLYIFGDNVEDKLGHVFYAIFYLACGLAADVAQMTAMGDSDIPMLGASGAISGVVGAYVVMFPHAKIKLLFWFYFYVNVFHVTSVWWIGFWFAQQLFFGLVDISGKGGVAYWAHIGGFVLGAGAAALVKYVIAPSLFQAGPAVVRTPPAGIAPKARGSGDDVEWEPEDPSTYAVLRADGRPGLSNALANQIAAETGESPHDVIERIRRTRGMLARNIDLPTAQRIIGELRRSGVRALSVADTERNRPAIPFQPARIAWNAEGLLIEERRIAWSSIVLMLGAQLGGVRVLDLFAGRRTRLRIAESTELRIIDPVTNRLHAASLPALAKAIERLGAPTNEGVGVLAGNGTWGWLAFPNEAEYEDYAFWVYNLTMARV